MKWANPYMLRDHWLSQGKHNGEKAYGAETWENYGRDLGVLTEDGQPLDLLRLQEWKDNRDAAARAGEPFAAVPPALGWIQFIGDLIWEATPFHVDAWLNQWPAAAIRSRSRRRSSLFSFYEHAVREGIVPGNPVRPIRPGVSPGLPGRVKLTRRQAGMLRSAADRYADPRDRLLIYLLLAKLRPFQATGIWLERTFPEQHRVVSRIPVKGGGYAPEPWEWPAECVEALDAYVPDFRIVRPPYSSKEQGPLFTSRNGRQLDADKMPRVIVRQIAEMHVGLTEIAPRLTADGVALGPSPFEDDKTEPSA
ncbi:hypothetical protein AB0A05_27025 [Streptomyces sp. NPDC046374]|uniref:hypothetical protein n=1 Tax=Streptomyces sp. NPDC046374 TaxID=3154917 RepID=UPI0033CA4D14